MQRHQEQKKRIGLVTPSTLPAASNKIEKIFDELFVGNAAIDPNIPKNVESQGLVGILSRNLTACIEWAKQLARQTKLPKTAQSSIDAYLNALIPLRDSVELLNRYFRSIYGNDRNAPATLDSLVKNFVNLRIYISYTVAQIRFSKQIEPNALDVFVGIMPKTTKKEYQSALQSVEPMPAFKNVFPGQSCIVESSIVQFYTKLSLLLRELQKEAPQDSEIYNYVVELQTKVTQALQQHQEQQAILEERYCQKSYRKKEAVCNKVKPL